MAKVREEGPKNKVFVNTHCNKSNWLVDYHFLVSSCPNLLIYALHLYLPFTYKSLTLNQIYNAVDVFIGLCH